MKLLFLLLSISFSVQSHSDKLMVGKNDALEKEIAFDYADFLIKEFDKDLDKRLNDKVFSFFLEDFLETSLYAKILSARRYIEKRSASSSNKSFSILRKDSLDLYSKVISTIDSDAQKIKSYRLTKSDSLKREQALENTIYPSISRAGNLTGNTFPNKVWSLTFDDGPRAKSTKVIVDNLYKRGIKATFFMLTREAKKFPDTAKYVVDSGMTIALHSYNHKNLVKESLKTVEYEITTAKEDLEQLLGVKTKTFRLPYGSGVRNTDLRTVIEKNNYIHIFWNVDTLDWKDKDPQSILSRVKKQMKLTPNNSGVILFHDIHSQTVVASELTMDYLLSEGHRICTVEELIEWHNGIDNSCLSINKN